jgi:hypothetical protein
MRTLRSRFRPALLCAAGVLTLSLQSFAAAPLPDDLAPYFKPPVGMTEPDPELRSPLQFADASVAKTPEDWARRREEIRRRWMEIMGAWPALLEKPKLVVLEKEPRENFTQCRIEVEVAANQMTKGYLLIPNGAAKAPAVFVPYYEPETSIGLKVPLRDFAYQLARRGFVTLAIGSPGGDARQPELGGVQLQPLSYLGYVSANCAGALASLPEVDPARIGVVGHSYGGKWAMFAACLSERFACGVWSDPGIVFDEKRSNVNYWEKWYLGAQPGEPRKPGIPDTSNPRTGAYKTLVEQRMDLHELQALMAPRPFLVSGGAEDGPARWGALNHVIAVDRLLGYEQRVGMSNRPAHAPTLESNELIYRFFEHFLAPAR